MRKTGNQLKWLKLFLIDSYDMPHIQLQSLDIKIKSIKVFRPWF